MRVINFVLIVVAMMFVPVMAYADDVVVTVDSVGFVDMIVGVLPAVVELMPSWFGVLVGVLYAVSHLIATLPLSVTAGWPSWLKSLINLLAANYGKAKNKVD